MISVPDIGMRNKRGFAGTSAKKRMRSSTRSKGLRALRRACVAALVPKSLVTRITSRGRNVFAAMNAVITSGTFVTTCLRPILNVNTTYVTTASAGTTRKRPKRNGQGTDAR